MFRSYLREALHDTENKLRSIVENSVDGVVMADQEGYVVLWNPGQERITEISAGEALGKPIWDILWTLAPAQRRKSAFHEQLRRRLLGAVQSEANSSSTPSLEIEIERPSGEQRIVQQFTFVFATADGPRLGCVFRDVTNLRQAARSLLRRNAELNLVNRINGVLASTLDFEQVRKTVLKEIVQLFHVTGAGIWLVDEESRALVCVQSLNQAGEAVPDSTLALWEPQAAHAFRLGRTLVTADTATGEWPATPAVGAGAAEVQPLACVPMQARETVLGVLLLEYHSIKRVNAADISILESIAAAAASAFENIRLYQKAQELAILQERQRLAITLHEAINQSLFSAGLIAEVLPRLIERDPAQASDAVQDLRKLLRGAVTDLREVLVELQPSLVDHEDFSDLLRQLAAGYTGRTGTTVAINVAANVTFPVRVQEALYQLCREVFTNIAKHADATQVWVELTRKSEGVAIVIRDNGCGLDLGRLPTGHFGLAMMQQQATQIGAAFYIVSEIGQGTEINILVPTTVG
jgi:two-component system nitrate/nitrite sensor histidine kinase NarX